MILVCKNDLEIRMCANFFRKLMGLMFKKNFDYGLCFKRCNSIHTFFMREKIDVIMTDKNNKVLYVYNNLKKYRIILPRRKVYYTYEIPCNNNIYNIGDYLQFK